MPTFSLLDEQEKAELWSTLALRHSRGIGARKGRQLLEMYGSAFAAVQAERVAPGAWKQTGIMSTLVCRTFASEAWRTKALEEWNTLRVGNFSFFYYFSPEYPELLKEICDAPLLLYYQGDIGLLRNPMVAVVGSRDCTREGLLVSAFFSRALSKAGVTVVSGMAKGVDRAAHLGGLEGAGSSVAILGTGIDVLYPSSNADLGTALLAQGLILSEFAPQTMAHPRHFPVRNRIISGLSRGVLVVEASKRSGSLITARLALEQGRDVFAVPGHTMAPVSEGCRELIRSGAKPVFNADDILYELAPMLALDVQKALQQRKTQPIAIADYDAPEEGTLLVADLPLIVTEPVQQKKSRKALADTGNTVKGVGFSCSKSENELARLTSERGVSKKVSSPKACSASGSPAAGPGVCTCHKNGERARVLPAGMTESERLILDALHKNAMHIDTLAQNLAIEISQLSTLLVMLEIQGHVVRNPGMVYSLS